jgi:hypothetical protein
MGWCFPPNRGISPDQRTSTRSQVEVSTSQALRIWDCSPFRLETNVNDLQSASIVAWRIRSSSLKARRGEITWSATSGSATWLKPGPWP